MFITSPDIDGKVDGSYKLILFVIAKLTDIITADRSVISLPQIISEPVTSH